MNRSINIKKLEPTKHMFEWLAEKPFETMLNNIDSILSKQVKNASIQHFEAISEPQWLKGGIHDENNVNKVVLVRTGVAFEFKLTVISPDGKELLSGVYSWVRKKVGDQFYSQTWFDINGTLDEFGDKGALAERIY